MSLKAERKEKKAGKAKPDHEANPVPKGKRARRDH